MFAFAVFDLVFLLFSVLSQEIGWEEGLRLFGVGWDVKP